MWANIKTEFSFKSVYGHIDDIAKKCAIIGNCGGMTDTDSTFGHIQWRKACKKAGIKPIYGVRLPVMEDPLLKERRIAMNYMTFIAKSTSGLQEIYALVNLAYKQFYYKTRISYDQVNDLSDEVFILMGTAPILSMISHPNSYKELGLHIPFSQREFEEPAIACIDNFYPNIEDRIIYEPFAENRLMERKTYPLHIPTPKEWLLDFPGREDALVNLKMIADICNVELPNAPMVKYIGQDDIKEWCEQGARKHGLDIWNDGEYKERYDREIELITDKDYIDYFLVVADLIRYAKDRMAVGPSRGSSAGSLVCYLMGITEIDPLEYDLYFERFIDVNRFDLPDIDIDFQDDKRNLCLKYLEKKYGKSNVAQIANISRMKPKSAIARFAKSLNVPIGDVEELKDAIMERSGGDARANFCMEDTFTDTDIGKSFLEKYPEMGIVSKIEAHASHTSVHAAGILVCNSPITSYAGVNCRDNKRIAMLDKKDAEAINLLKIDALGLRTLSILATVCDQIGKPYEWLYEIPLDDQLTYKVFNDQRYNGIFQFEGPAVNGLAKQMEVIDIEDVAALTALGRPGPLNSGGANRYIKFRTGKEPVKYISDHPIVVEALKPTYGVAVYQEQTMKIVKELGKLSWEETSSIRKAMSKSLGVEFFDKMWKSFEKGCKENGLEKEESRKIWDNISSMGSWAFNKCLSGNTRIKMMTPGPYKRYHGSDFCTIEKLYEIQYDLSVSPQLISLQSDGKILPQRLLYIHRNGEKFCYEYEFDDGTSVICTEDHKFIINDNWCKIGDAKIGDIFSGGANYHTPKKKRKNIHKKGKGGGFQPKGEDHPTYINGFYTKMESFRDLNKNKPCKICGEFDKRREVHHLDMDHGKTDPDALEWLCTSCHAKKHVKAGKAQKYQRGLLPTERKLISISEFGITETYDIEMPDHHNFLLENGLITHNSHAVSYGLISYLCAYMKANHPLEFTVACLNHAKSDQSALKILRDAVENDGVEYSYFDKMLSEKDWCVKDGILYGGLQTIHGMGPKKASQFIKLRENRSPLPTGMKTTINKAQSTFKYLYPGKELYGDFYDDPESLGLKRRVTHIKDTQEDGTYVIIGCLIKKNLRDANEACFVNERSGKYETGQTSWLNLTLEDDTDSVMCKIKKDDYIRLGKHIAETGKQDKDWYVVFGKKINGWSLIFVENIQCITREV